MKKISRISKIQQNANYRVTRKKIATKKQKCTQKNKKNAQKFEKSEAPTSPLMPFRKMGPNQNIETRNNS